MKIELNGRTAVVTGGYGAIGAAMCKKLAGAGANIVVVGRNKDKGAAFEKELKVGRRQRCLHMRRRYGQTEHGGICAPRRSRGSAGSISSSITRASTWARVTENPIHEFSDEDWTNIIDTDLNGVYYCSKPVVRHMAKNGIRPDHQRQLDRRAGAAAQPVRFHGGKGRRREPDQSDGARACAISYPRERHMPRLHHVRGHAQALLSGTRRRAERMLSHIPLGRPGEPEEIAGATVYLASDEASYMTGKHHDDRRRVDLRLRPGFLKLYRKENYDNEKVYVYQRGYAGTVRVRRNLFVGNADGG